MPPTLPSLTRSAIFCARLSGLVWYGSSVTTRHWRSWISSTATTARIVMEPRPVRYASSMPLRPTTSAPVGKSGPLIRSMRASSSSSCEASGCSRDHCAPAATSRRLCGGMLVAMPTAMPAEPLISRFGKRAGRTVGSWLRPS